jgi:threonine dehydratase
MSVVGLDRIVMAQERIFSRVRHTPLTVSDSLSARCGFPIYLKLESHQPTGSFKLRGATNAVLSMSDEAKKRGLVAASTGNHGRALAHAAKAEGARAVICMSALVPANKVDAIKALGAEVRIVGRSQDDAQEEVERLVREEGLTAIPPFDHAVVIAGQGLKSPRLAQRPNSSSSRSPAAGWRRASPRRSRGGFHMRA